MKITVQDINGERTFECEEAEGESEEIQQICQHVLETRAFIKELFLLCHQHEFPGGQCCGCGNRRNVSPATGRTILEPLLEKNGLSWPKEFRGCWTPYKFPEWKLLKDTRTWKTVMGYPDGLDDLRRVYKAGWYTKVGPYRVKVARSDLYE